LAPATRYCSLFFLSLIPLFVFVLPGSADDYPLISRGEGATYHANVSGTIGSTYFSNALTQITLRQAPPASKNQYILIVEGLPEISAKNSFNWISESTTMNVVANEITCNITGNAVKMQTDARFFYLSPTLLEREDYRTAQEQERLERSKKMAKPTKVFAQDGALKLKFTPGEVTGSVWLKGYDPIEKSYVTYQGYISGRSTEKLELKHVSD